MIRPARPADGSADRAGTSLRPPRPLGPKPHRLKYIRPAGIGPTGPGSSADRPWRPVDQRHDRNPGIDVGRQSAPRLGL